MYFGRLLTAMVTPFDQNLQVDYAKVEELVEHLIATGSDGIVVAGTTGESPTLSHEEKVELFRKVKEIVKGRVSIVAGTGSNNTQASIELTKEAEEIGVDGVMLVVPYYNKPPQDAMIAHFTAIANATKLPVLLYNVPGRTSKNLEPKTVQKLAEIPNIVAIKEAAGDLDQVSMLRKLLPADFQIYSGDDSLTLPILSVGGHGIISVASHVAGKEMKEMIDAFFSGDNAKALEMHLKLHTLFKNLFLTSNPIPVKAAVTMIGIDVGGLRLPLIEANDQEKEIIRQTLKDLGKL